MKSVWFAAGVAIFAGAASAQDAAPDRSITIYNNNLALMQETRTLTLAAGRQRVEFKDVSAQIRPETVSLSAPGMSVVEQNFDFDLLSPAKMMEKAVGQQVQIVRINPGNGQEVRETATALSVNDGVVLRIGDRIEILRDDGAPTRVIFDKVPETLRARPTLSVTVNAAAAGARQARLSYLSTGLSWKADYVALFDEKAGKLDLQGWITLTNNSGTAYENAQTQLVAGQVQLSNGNVQNFRPPAPRPGPGSTTSAGTEGGATGADYLVYSLPQRTTIANNQTKQVGFLDANAVTASKQYQFRAYGFASWATPSSAEVAVNFSNSRASGLGAALPAGIMRVYIRDAAGDPKFSGENAVSHTPQGSELSVKIGDAFDVTVQPTVINSTRLGERNIRYEMSYLVRNARAAPVTVRLVQGGLATNARITAESLKNKSIDASTVAWDVPVPANGQTTVTFTLDNRW